MAGFLSPVLSDIGAAPGGVGSSVDTSVGDALGAFGNILGDVGRSGSSSAGPTQTDRDTANAQPFIDEAIRLEALRASGSNISTRQLNAEIRANKIGAVTAFAGRSDGIIKSLSSIHGEDIDVKETDLLTARNNIVTDFFTKDPIGIDKMPRAIVLDANGEFDEGATRVKMEALFQNHQAQVANDATLADDLARAIAAGDLNKENQKVLADPFIQQGRQAATETVNGLATTFDLANATLTPKDVSNAIITVTAARDRFLATVNSRAADIGILNDKDVYDSALVVEPFNTLLSTLNIVQTNPEMAVNMQRAGAELKQGEFLLNLGVQPTRSAIDYVAALSVQAASVDIINGINTFTKKPVEPTTAEIPSFGVIDPSQSAINPELVRAAGALPESKQIEVVQRSLDGFYISGDYNGTDPVVRTEAVENFGRAVGVMVSTGKQITKATFDKTYRPEFVQMYNDITATDDDTSTRFRALVAEHIGTTLQQMEVRTQTSIQNDFSERLPGLSLTFNGKEYDVAFDEDLGLGTDSDLVVGALKKLGLPPTMSGLSKLASDRTLLISSGVSPTEASRIVLSSKQVLGVLKPQIDYLNRIIAVGSQLEGVDAVLPTAGGKDKAEVIQPTVISSEEDFNNLKDGTPWRFVDDDGNVFTGIAGRD